MTREKQKVTAKTWISIAVILVGFIGYMLLDTYLSSMRRSLLIDNPTASAVSLSIDGQPYEVPAGEYIKIKLEAGQHTLTCAQYGYQDEPLVLTPAWGVINPTRSKYVIYSIIYTEKDLSSQFEPFQVEGREIYSFALFGAPEVTDALFIMDRTAGNGGNLDVKNPSTKKYNRISEDYAYLAKIFRINDFFEFYDKHNR